MHTYLVPDTGYWLKPQWEIPAIRGSRHTGRPNFDVTSSWANGVPALEEKGRVRSKRYPFHTSPAATIAVPRESVKTETLLANKQAYGEKSASIFHLSLTIESCRVAIAPCHTDKMVCVSRQTAGPLLLMPIKVDH